METINDILEEMRSANFQPSKYQAWVDGYCDRIEAAWAEEAKAIAVENAVLPAVCITKPSGNTEFKFVNGFGIEFPAPLNTNPAQNVNSEKVIYNAAKMREALEAVIKVGYPHNFQREAPHIREYCYDITKAIKKCFAALSAPARNCDVGTAEEQIVRFNAECLAIRKRNTVEPCAGCPCSRNGEGTEDCQLRWAQMPYAYEEGSAK